MVYAVSHDLGEPARKVVQFGTLIERRLGSDADEDAARCLGYMVSAGRRLQAMLAAMLKWSRVASTAGPRVPTELASVVSQAVGSRQALLDEAGATLSVDVTGAAEMDGPAVSTLLGELIDNTLRFVREEGGPTIRIRSQAAVLPGDGRQAVRPAVAVVVADDGIGFDPQFAEAILRPFRRLHTREEYPGVGMGLAICSRIADLHDGTLHADGALGQGATITLTIPLRSERGGGST